MLVCVWEVCMNKDTTIEEKIEYFYPDSHLIIYYEKLIAGLEDRLYKTKLKLEQLKRNKND